jgi:hypothetical protein
VHGTNKIIGMTLLAKIKLGLKPTAELTTHYKLII